MSDVTFHNSDEGFNRYLFEYRHGGTEWGIEIVARSPQEAKERIQALTWARYQGEIQATLRIPTGRSSLAMLRRFLRRLFGTS